MLEEEEIIIIVESDGELEGLSGPETDSEEELVCPTAEQAAGAGEVEDRGHRCSDRVETVRKFSTFLQRIENRVENVWFSVIV